MWLLNLDFLAILYQIELWDRICQAKKKNTAESCLVRGYWGDIIISPYIAFGVECDYKPESEKLFKIANK